MGMHTAENAHPFNIKNKLIFAHNGKIENIWPLLRQYDIDSQPIHVDSQGLGELLVKEGQKILAEYKGFAAILAHDMSKPNTLFAYHGASRDFKSDALPKEERPLFYMTTPEGVYFSSMKEALLFIEEDTDDKPDVVPHNILFTFENGKVIKQSKKIAREDRNIFVVEPSKTTTYYDSEAHNSRIGKAYAGMKGYKEKALEASKEKPLSIHAETIPPEFGDENQIYYYRNRYWIGTMKADGSVVANSEGKVLKDGEKMVKPTTLYFFRGVYLKGEKEYKHIHKQLQNPESDLMKTLSFGNMNFAKLISKWSKYPVTNIEEESKDVADEFKKKFYSNEKEVSGESITPVFSTRTYVYREGALKDIKATGGTPTMEFFLKREDEGNESGTGIQRNGQSDAESQKTKDEKRRDLVADICNRLHLDKITPNVEKTIALFYEKYNTLAQVNCAMFGIGDAVMKLYVIDIMQNLCQIPNPRPSLIYDSIQDVYHQAIVEKVPLADLMEEGIEMPEYYIGEILQDWDFEDGEKPKSNLPIEIKAVPDLTLPVTIKDYFEKTNGELFKNFDKKKEI
jgi:hypothetical protein